MGVKIKRAYAPPEEGDGTRILVDRLWPRGVAKEDAKIDLWLKEVAPSAELRQWFGHDPDRWEEFKARYREELKGQEEAVRLLKEEAARGEVTLVYAAKNEENNNAVALKEYLEESP